MVQDSPISSSQDELGNRISQTMAVTRFAFVVAAPIDASRPRVMDDGTEAIVRAVTTATAAADAAVIAAQVAVSTSAASSEKQAATPLLPSSLSSPALTPRPPEWSPRPPDRLQHPDEED